MASPAAKSRRKRALKPDDRQWPAEWASLAARVKAGDLPRVVIVGNPDKPSTADVVESLRRRLAGKAEIVDVDLGRPLKSAGEVADVDFYIVIGGDGTLLGAARSLQDRQVPLVGIHLGHLGFLTAFTEKEFPKHLDALLRGELPVSRRITLECCIKRGPAALKENVENQGVVLTDFSAWAINECVVTAGFPFRMVHMRLFVNGQLMTEVTGDGVIVATPGGSTAYNMSAGGPLVAASVRALVVTPLSPHSVTHKPAVVEDSSVIEIVAERVNPGTTCILDGHILTPIREGDRIQIKRGPYELLLVRHPAAGDWDALRRMHLWKMPTLQAGRRE